MQKSEVDTEHWEWDQDSDQKPCSVSHSCKYIKTYGKTYYSHAGANSTYSLMCKCCM